MEKVLIGRILDMPRNSLRGIKHFGTKKRPLQKACFEIKYTFPNPKFNKLKESQLDPTGNATHLPSVDKAILNVNVRHF